MNVSGLERLTVRGSRLTVEEMQAYEDLQED
jgi:hypothetical protein